MNAKHPATEPAPASKSDSDVLAELFAMLREKVTDAPALTNDNVSLVVRGVVAALAKRNEELARSLEDVARLREYCDTLHGFIKKGGL